jgi:IS5 family transposase
MLLERMDDMREAFRSQLSLGFVNISEIVLNIKSRHELVPILKALQHVYSNQEEYEKILSLIRADILEGKSADWGKKGMRFWEILVLAAVRLGCNLDYDALEDLANQHRKLREMMGLGLLETREFSRSCLQENLSKLSVHTIRAIDRIIVGLGHDLEPEAAERVRVDTFVVETNVHFPTDANLMQDGICKIIFLVTQLAKLAGIAGMRKSEYWLKKTKKLQRRIGGLRKSQRKDAPEEMTSCYEEFIALGEKVIELALRIVNTAASCQLELGAALKAEHCVNQIYWFATGTAHMMDLARRRVLNGEKIPHNEKLFSLFESHTEMINRGKTPYPWEFGHKVWIAEDKAGFIVDHDIMGIGDTDEKWTVEIAERVMLGYGDKVQWLSFDSGFYTPLNRIWLKEMVPNFCLPKKGTSDKMQQQLESAEGFKEARRKHSGVESGINGLDHCGLTRCRDKGRSGYDRYVPMAIMGRNLYTLGKLLLAREREESKVNHLAGTAGMRKAS